MLPRIRAAGYRAALAARDGMDTDEVPFPEIDLLFLGGHHRLEARDRRSGPGGRSPRPRCQHPHGQGRVNSLRRLRYALQIGCDSVDGTFLAYGPNRNLPTLLGRFRSLTSDTTGRPNPPRLNRSAQGERAGATHRRRRDLHAPGVALKKL